MDCNVWRTSRYGTILLCPLVQTFFQKEGVSWLINKGEVQAGEIAYTTAGRLPYKCIIHAVGKHITIQLLFLLFMFLSTVLEKWN
jgi:hypothetical protein